MNLKTEGGENTIKKLSIIIGCLLFFAVTAGAVFAAKPDSNGYDQYGYNYTARLMNGWYGQWAWKAYGIDTGTLDAWLSMKWSKDWIPQDDEPVGAWTTNHWIWYTDDYSGLDATWYGFINRIPWTQKDSAPQAKYLATEFLKIQKVSDNSEAWQEYEAGDAYDALWGSYLTGVPKYVVFQDVITLYQRSWNVQGNWIFTFHLGGDYPHDVFLSQSGTTITGNGGYLAGTLPYTYTWDITSGSVVDDTIQLTIDYTLGAVGTTMHVTGTIAPDGTMSGVWDDNFGGVRNGTWTATSGKAVAAYTNVVDTFNIAKTGPKGLGQPIF